MARYRFHDYGEIISVRRIRSDQRFCLQIAWETSWDIPYHSIPNGKCHLWVNPNFKLYWRWSTCGLYLVNGWITNQVQIIEHRGYTAQTHFLQTEDGYRLQVHRIPYGKKYSHIKNVAGVANIPIGRPVLLAHPFSGSSADYVISPTNQSLGI